MRRSKDPRWLSVDIKAGKRMTRPVSLAAIKGHRLLSGMAVARHSRLSVSPVSEEEWAAVLQLATRRG